jgi:hypothetical protein
MKRFLRLKAAGSSATVHLGTDDPETGGYLSLCGKSLVGRISGEPVTEYRGDECARCRKKAEGRWESVGGQWLDGYDGPGGIKFPRGTKQQVTILPRRKDPN